MRMPRPVALSIVIAGVLVAACRDGVPDIPQLAAKEYADTLDAFHARRATAIAGPEGWATHLGLWWLKPGVNRIGADPVSAIALPSNRSPRVLGDILVEGDSARFVPARGASIHIDKSAVTAPVTLHSDVEGNQTVLRAGSLVISYITRGGGTRKAVRIKDTLHVARAAFPGHRYFPADTTFRVTAHFIPKPQADSMNIVDVLGIETRMWWPGELRFRLEGKDYVLQVIREPEDHGKQLFVMFKDSTNLNETYPAMRYTYVAPPDSLGRTVLDFNQSYSPPCAFTAFATCPLPPAGNVLPIRITAGELRPAHH
jgi:uncharacterized protein (DUF1684 family)